ncbi:hypothetical protein ACUNV4_29125 [Granulosicoccus sp. 3-233]|uniref:hypothetical protein n=1 Tax=Granulosicoccus sp. 3-233 TaxID=3417969 RepID=UPI003D3451BC
MNIEPKSRQQKLVEAIYAYFGDMTDPAAEDAPTLRICKHLLTLGDELMSHQHTLSFIDLWNAEYAEEEAMTREELLWALTIFDTNMTRIIQERRKSRQVSGSNRPRLRVINGGLSDRPDRPPVATEVIREEYDLDF